MNTPESKERQISRLIVLTDELQPENTIEASQEVNKQLKQARSILNRLLYEFCEEKLDDLYISEFDRAHFLIDMQSKKAFDEQGFYNFVMDQLKILKRPRPSKPSEDQVYYLRGLGSMRIVTPIGPVEFNTGLRHKQSIKSFRTRLESIQTIFRVKTVRGYYLTNVADLQPGSTLTGESKKVQRLQATLELDSKGSKDLFE